MLLETSDFLHMDSFIGLPDIAKYGSWVHPRRGYKSNRDAEAILILLPSLGNHIPSVLLYSLGHTGQS